MLWDWDSWLTNVALRQIVAARGDAGEGGKLAVYEKGCIRNWIEYSTRFGGGYVPIWVTRSGNTPPAGLLEHNMHKPCLCQHAAFIVRSGFLAMWAGIATPEQAERMVREH